MDDLDQQYEDNLRTVALNFVTANFRARVTKGHEKIRDCLQQIGQEIELVTDEQKRLLDWYKQKTGSDDTVVKDKLRPLNSGLHQAPWRSARYDLRIPLVIEQSSIRSPDDTATRVALATLPHDTPGPANVVHHPATIETPSADHVVPPAATGEGHANGDIPTGRSKKRKTPHGEPIDIPAALRSLESRGFVQRAEVSGRSFAFEYPRGTGNFCIIKCSDCGWLCELGPERSMPIENHWLINRFHRELNRNENRPPPSIREILEQHTFRVEGATLQWATESNRQTVAKKNAARHPGGSQGSHTTPKPRSSVKPRSNITKPSSPRFVAPLENSSPRLVAPLENSSPRLVAPLDKSYRGRIRSDMAKDKYELRPKANPKERWANDRASSSSLSPPCSDYDDGKTLASVFGACEAEAPNQDNGGEFTREESTTDRPDKVTHEESTTDGVRTGKASHEAFTTDRFTPNYVTDEEVTDAEVTDEEVVYIRTVVRQVVDMPPSNDFEEKELADIKTEPGLDHWG